MGPEPAGWSFGVATSGTIEEEAIGASLGVERFSSLWVEEQGSTIDQFLILTGSGNMVGVPANETASVSEVCPMKWIVPDIAMEVFMGSFWGL